MSPAESPVRYANGVLARWQVFKTFADGHRGKPREKVTEGTSASTGAVLGFCPFSARFDPA